MKYYFGGYYLIKPRKVNFGNLKGKTIVTCSSCINDSLFDSWTLSWGSTTKEQIDELRNELQINEQKQNEIQNWADIMFNNGKMGWLEVFGDLKTINEYAEKFFAHIENKMILKIGFPENEMRAYLNAFKPRNEKEGKTGIYQNLLLEQEFTENEKDEEFIGYDIIGVENGGADFHTFHCHDLQNDLQEKFGLKFNQHGLIKEIEDTDKVLDYMNYEDNGFEPVPWFLIKVNRVKEAST